MADIEIDLEITCDDCGETMRHRGVIMELAVARIGVYPCEACKKAEQEEHTDEVLEGESAMSKKADHEAVKAEREQFEAWVGNPYMLDKHSDPECFGEYEEAWARGAWEAWKYLRKEQRDSFPMEAVRHLSRCVCHCQRTGPEVDANAHLESCMVGQAQKYLGVKVMKIDL